MSSLCWPHSGKHAIPKENRRGSVRYLLVFLGIWLVNVLVIFFGLPFLIYQALKR